MIREKLLKELNKEVFVQYINCEEYKKISSKIEMM